MPDGGYAWHVHHRILVERLTESIEVRRAYIRRVKPAGEVELRLRLLQPVRGDIAGIPAVAACEQAWVAYDQARIAYVRAGVACDQAWADYDQARIAYEQARAAYEQARAVYDRAWAESDQARIACDQAWADYEQARIAVLCDPAVLALHAAECGCAWDGNILDQLHE